MEVMRSGRALARCQALSPLPGLTQELRSTIDRHGSLVSARRSGGKGRPRAVVARGRRFGRLRGGRLVSKEVLTIVRRQPVQTFLRFATPSMTNTLDWMFGLNMRFVRRLEKLTLWPNLVVLPQTSHLPATS